MIRLQLKITNPFTDRFSNIRCWSGKTFIPNKYWELQVMRTDSILELELGVTTHCDHAGVDIWLGLFGYTVSANIYDNRHWDRENNCWCVYD